MIEPNQSAMPAGRRASVASWVIAVSLALIALNMTLRADPFGQPAQAQSVRFAGARGIFAFTGPTTQSSYGVYMVDVDSGTLWCYEWATTPQGVKRLRLVSARSWIFDRYLEEYNVDGLSPSDVEELVDEQRRRRETRLDIAKP